MAPPTSKNNPIMAVAFGLGAFAAAQRYSCAHLPRARVCEIVEYAEPRELARALRESLEHVPYLIFAFPLADTETRDAMRAVADIEILTGGLNG